MVADVRHLDSTSTGGRLSFPLYGEDARRGDLRP